MIGDSGGSEPAAVANVLAELRYLARRATDPLAANARAALMLTSYTVERLTYLPDKPTRDAQLQRPAA